MPERQWYNSITLTLKCSLSLPTLIWFHGIDPNSVRSDVVHFQFDFGVRAFHLHCIYASLSSAFLGYRSTVICNRLEYFLLRDLRKIHQRTRIQCFSESIQSYFDYASVPLSDSFHEEHQRGPLLLPLEKWLRRGIGESVYWFSTNWRYSLYLNIAKFCANNCQW